MVSTDRECIHRVVSGPSGVWDPQKGHVFLRDARFGTPGPEEIRLTFLEWVLYHTDGELPDIDRRKTRPKMRAGRMRAGAGEGVEVFRALSRARL
jgi:hypothetical protein